MKTGVKIFGLLAGVFTALLLWQSCSRDDEGGLSEADLNAAQDEVYIDALFDEIGNFTLAEVMTLDDNDYSSLKSAEVLPCYTVAVDHPDTTTFPKVITVDFGQGCTVVINGDTITRSGKILITLTNRWYIPQTQIITTFNNFYYNGAKIEGTRTMTNLGLNERNRLELSIELQNGKVTFGENKWMTREASHLRQWARYPNPLNDSLIVTGTASGINIDGETYTREIVEELILRRCEQYRWRWMITSGKVEITNSARGNMTLEHSSNGCEGTVKVTKDGDEFEYQFRFKNPTADN